MRNKEKVWIQSYDKHVPASLVYPDLSICDLLNNTVEKNPQKPWVIFDGNEITYEQMSFLIDCFSTGLRQIGIRKGAPVGIAFPNTPQFLIAFFACMRIGAIVVAINPFSKPAEIESIIKECEIKTVICGSESLASFNSIFDSSQLEKIISSKERDILWLIDNIHAIRGDLRKQWKNRNKNGEIPFIDLFYEIEINDSDQQITKDDIAVYQFSGGTTGTPKAAIGLHKNLVANTIQFFNWCDFHYGDEVILAAIPLYHVYGMVLALNLSLAAGSSIVLIKDARNVDAILEALQKNYVTFFPGVPTIFHLINNHILEKFGKLDLSKIKACISGSAPLLPEIKSQFENLTGSTLIEGYGLSEAPTATHCNPVYGFNKTGSIGLPLPNVDCKIVDLEKGTREVGEGEIGELIIRGPQVMAGYFNNPKETQLTLRNGWLFTGDVAYMDQKGYFYIVDRKKSLIKVGGFQVWPNEIEKALSSHPNVKEAGVGGVPDIERGERVIAWVVAKENCILDKKELQGWCESVLSSYKIPQEFIFVDALPRTRVGKILRRELIRTYIDNH